MITRTILPALLITCLCPALAADDYARNPGIDIIHYIFDVTLNDLNQVIEGNTNITIRFLEPNITGFHLDLHNERTKETEKGEDEKGMNVSSVMRNRKGLSFTHENDRLLVKMATPSEAGECRTFSVFYSGIPADGLVISNNLYEDRTFFSDSWPDRARSWLPTVDHPSDKATCEFKITASNDYQVVANGSLVEIRDLENDRRLTHWKQVTPISTKIMVIGVAQFAVIHQNDFREIPVQLWIYPEDREYALIAFKATARIMDFYHTHIGPYPFSKLAHVQAVTQYGGVENAGTIFYHQGGEDGPRWSESLIAHEIAHQWFGDSVTERDWNHIWLSEGFATYFTSLYFEHRYGMDRLKERMKRSRARVLRSFKNHPESSVIESSISDPRLLLTDNAYQKGAWVLHMLRRRIGDELWWAGIRRYYSTFRNSTVLTEDFVNVMEKTSNQELSWFFDQWLLEPGHPVIDESWNYDAATNKLHVKLDQVQAGEFIFKAPVDIGIFHGNRDRYEVETVEINKRENAFIFDYESAPSKLEIDPDIWLLMEPAVSENLAEEQKQR